MARTEATVLQQIHVVRPGTVEKEPAVPDQHVTFRLPGAEPAVVHDRPLPPGCLTARWFVSFKLVV